MSTQGTELNDQDLADIFGGSVVDSGSNVKASPQAKSNMFDMIARQNATEKYVSKFAPGTYEMFFRGMTEKLDGKYGPKACYVFDLNGVTRELDTGTGNKALWPLAGREGQMVKLMVYKQPGKTWNSYQVI